MKSNQTETADRSVVLLGAFVYLVQGALSLTAIAFPLFLRGKGWSISDIATFAFFSGLPWALKVFYGAFSDEVLIGRLRRKPYVIFASFVSAAAWVAFALFPHGRISIYGFAIVANLGFALTDVVTDALIVENSTEKTAQLYQSVAWGFRSGGAVLGGVLGGWLAQNLPYRWIFGITALLPLTTLVAGSFIHESPREKRRESSNLLAPILESFRALFAGDLKWFSFLLLVSSFSASFSTPFFFFLKETLAFSETFLGLLSSLTWLGAIGGCFIYGRFLNRISIKVTLYWAIGLNTINVLMTCLITNPWSAGTFFFLGGILGYLTLLPLMAASALLARQKGIEGSLFALLMSVHNLGQILSVFLGGKLFDIIGLGSLIFFSATVGLTGFIFVARLRTL